MNVMMMILREICTRKRRDQNVVPSWWWTLMHRIYSVNSWMTTEHAIKQDRNIHCKNMTEITLMMLLYQQSSVQSHKSKSTTKIWYGRRLLDQSSMLIHHPHAKRTGEDVWTVHTVSATCTVPEIGILQ